MIAAGADPMALSRGIHKAVEAVSKSILAMATPINEKNKKELMQIATIAGNNDPTIGSVLSEAFLKVGKDGVITVEEGKQAETSVDVVEGMQFDRGYLSPHFVTDADSQICEFENPYILLFEEKISQAKHLVPLLEAISKAGKPLVIIAEDVEGEALATLVVNKLRGIVQSVAVKAPGYGDRRKAIMGDLAVLTGGQAIFKDLGIALDAVKLTDLGRAKKVIIESENTTIVSGAGSKSAIDGRAAQIRAEIEGTDSDYDREKLQERLAKLTGGVAIVSVGAGTEAEMKQKKARVEDALHATRAAVEEGIVPGGGVALLRCREAVEKARAQAKGDEKIGVDIILHALEAPIRQIAENGGIDGAVVADEVAQKDVNIGYDAKKGEYVDMLKAGIIDPVKVVRVALTNAASISGLLLTTEALVTNLDKDDAKKRKIEGSVR